MRRLTASFLLFAYLFANTELHELAKISVFLAHYAEHRQEDQNMTLLAFIELHYFSGNIVDEDYEKDMQLPFKAVDCNSSSFTHTIPWPDFFLLRPAFLNESHKLPIYDQSALPSLHFADIWQPPKAC